MRDREDARGPFAGPRPRVMNTAARALALLMSHALRNRLRAP